MPFSGFTVTLSLIAGAQLITQTYPLTAG